MSSLRGKHIVITGGTGGIGVPLCRKLIEEGASLTVIALDASSEYPATFIRGNLASRDGISEITAKLEQGAPVDVLVNLAGMQYFGPVEAQPMEKVELHYAINLLAPVMLTQAVLPAMKDIGSGHIVNIGSIFGSINFAHFATYSSAKAGVKGFSEALRREVKSDGIDVTYIAPRAVKTPMNKGKVLEYADLTNMKMDEPRVVADRIARAIMSREKDVFIGNPESFFVRLNSIFPRLVDRALAKDDLRAKQLFQPQT